MRIGTSPVAFVLMYAVLGAAAENPAAVRLKPDPPIAVDAVLGDWSTIPPMAIAPSIRLAWREEALFLAIESNASILPLEITLQTQSAPARSLRIEGDVSAAQIVDAASGTVLDAARAAIAMSPGQWTAELSIPWGALAPEKPRAGDSFLVNVAGVSLPSVLTGADGTLPETSQAVTEAFALPRDGRHEVVVDVDAPGPDRQVVVAFLARLEFDQVAGYSASLMVAINGHELTQTEMVNKPLRARARGGDVYSLAAGKRLSVYYAPDFTSADLDSHYGLVDGIKACYFELDVTPWLVAGANTLVFTNGASAPVDQSLHVADVRLINRAASELAHDGGDAPDGPLEKYAPEIAPGTQFTFGQPDSRTISVTMGADVYVISSRFSQPDGNWTSGENAFYSHQRSVEKRDECLVVKDSFKNLTDRPMPIIQRHEWKPASMAKLWLAGLEQPDAKGSTISAANPTTFVATDAAGLGLIATGDVFRIHASNYCNDGVAGLADEQCVLAPGAEYTAAWAIVPVENPSYWDFINASRRLVGANFVIDGGFAFFRAGPLTDVWSDEETTNFVRFKDAKYACATIDHPMYNGFYPHGTAFQRITHDNFRNAFARRRQLMPDVKNLVYFHCFIDVVEDGPERFADARHLMPDGSHATYGQDHDRIYVPTSENTYGPEVAKNVDVILDDIGADGVYWDEHEYSRYLYHFGEPWDGVSGDIDASTFQVRGLKSSVTLITEPWRLALAKRMLERGPLIGNGPAVTKNMIALQFPCFVETGSITNCVQAHLYSPIALGDHLTEQSEKDAYDTMLAALDYGCVYHWYNDMTVIPTHHHLTQYMFPITPIELHEGFIIGKERIITNRSGLFGWGDASGHDVHIFDRSGHETDDIKASQVHDNGQTWTELRIPKGYSAAILRTATPGN